MLQQSVKSIRTLLSSATPPIDDVLQTGLYLKLIEMLNVSNDDDMLYDVVWCVINMASGTHEQFQPLIDNNVIRPLVALLEHDSMVIRDQVVWAIGNISGDCKEWTMQLIIHGALPRLVETYDVLMAQNESTEVVDMVSNISWAFSNLSRYGKHEKLPIYYRCLRNLMYLENYENIVQDACISLLYISNDDKHHSRRISEMIETGIEKDIVNVARNHSESSFIVMTCLRTLGNLITGSDRDTQKVLDAGFVDLLLYVVQEKKYSHLQKEVYWSISNISAGTESQIMHIFESGLIPHIFYALSSGVFHVKQEVIWAITNMILGGSRPHIQILYDSGILDMYCKELRNCMDADMKAGILRGVEKLATFPEVYETVDNENVRECLETLILDENKMVSNLAHCILNKLNKGDDDGFTCQTLQYV